MKKFINWITKTKKRKILSAILSVLILITSIRFIFFQPEEVFASTMHWSFSEGYGTTIGDGSGNSNSGTITNATWKTDDLCRTNKCLYFDGSGDFVSRADDIDLDFVAADDVTIMGWFRHPIVSTNPDYLVAKHESGAAGGYKVWMDSDGDIAFGIDDDGTWGPEDVVGDDQSKNYDDNKWHHFAAVKDGTTGIYLYIDGQLIDSDESLTATGTLANAATFYIGIDADGSSNGWEGFIDEIKIHREVRTTAQISADFAAGAPEDGAGTSFGGGDQSYLSDGLIGYWKLDETSSDAIDLSGNATILTNVSTTTYTGAKFGNAIEPDGTADYLQASDNSALSVTGSLTLAAWIQPDDTTGSQDIIAKWDGSNESYLLALEGANLRMYVDSSSNYQASTGTPITANVFQHVAGVYDAATATVKLYVNGSEVTSSTTGTIPASIGDDAGRFHLGAEDSTTTAANFYDGHIDEVRVYNRNLSPSEIIKLHNWAPGPTGYWSFDENTGTTTAYDHSGNGLNGTMANFTSGAWAPGKIGQALDFESSLANQVDISDNTLLDMSSSFTISYWFKPESITTGTTYRTIYSKGSGIFTEIVDNEVNCGFFYNGVGGFEEENTTIADLVAGNWYHTACVFDDLNNTIRVFLNGIEILTTTGITNTPFTNSADVNIGASDGIGSQVIDGALDDLRLYNYARTSGQVIEDMNASHPRPGSPIGSAIAHWKFEGNIGASANFPAYPGQDSSVNDTDVNLSAAVTLSTSGKSGMAYQGASNARATRTDDIDGRLDFAAVDNFTISAWFKRSTISSDEYILSKISSSGTFGYDLFMDSSGDIIFGITDQSGAAVNEETIGNIGRDYDDDSWHHAVAVKTGTSSIKLYIDGYEIASDTSLSETGPLAHDGLLRIGDLNSTDGTDEFLGSIDEVQIFRFALSSDQIKVLYNQSSSATLGSLSTDASGNPDNSIARRYCIPGDTSTCDTPVAHYTLNENGGQRMDSVSQTSSGLSGSQMSLGSTASTGESDEPQYVPGVLGSALDFDGSDDLAAVPDDADLDIADSVDFTLEAWIYREDHTTEDIIISKGPRTTSNTDQGYILWLDSAADTLRLRIHDTIDAFQLTGNTAINSPGWYHVAAVIDEDSEANSTLYINGINDTPTPSGTLTDVNSLETSRGFFLGVTGNGASEFNGRIDDVRMYRYARTPAQIMWDYNRGKPIGHWKFDECTGTTANDASFDAAGNNRNNDGTITPGASGTHTSAGTCNSGSASEMWDDGQTGKRNYSLDFDGTDDYVDMNDVAIFDFPDGRNFSIAGWFNRETFTTDDTIVAKKNDRTNSTAGYLAWIDASSDNIQFAVSDGDSANIHGVTGTTIFTSTGWHHFVIVYDDSSSTASKIYIDGKDDAATNSTTGTFASIGDLSNAVDFRIGSESDDGNPFAGELDDIQIFNYALTANQVKSLFNQGVANFAPDEGAP